MSVTLSEREKFIVHFMAASIFGIHENASGRAIDSAITKLTKARCQNLSFDDIDGLSDAILQESAKGAEIITREKTEMISNNPAEANIGQ